MNRFLVKRTTFGSVLRNRDVFLDKFHAARKYRYSLEQIVAKSNSFTIFGPKRADLLSKAGFLLFFVKGNQIEPIIELRNILTAI